MKSITCTFFAALVASLAQTANAHGYVQTLLINGKTYPAFDPNIDNYVDPLVNSKITRHIPNDGPVTDWTSKDLKCNVGAEDAQWRTTHTADVNAGSNISFTWVRWPNDHLGPITTYMADCGSSCTDFDGDGAVWFKIDELGLVSGDTSTGDWATLHLIKNQLTWTVTVPSSLASGNYLIRHEILALHSAHEPQFYPHCSQLVVKGSGTSKPAASEMVAVTSIYSNNTSTNIDIWTNPAHQYPIAGPPVTKLQSYSTTNAKNLNGASIGASSQGSAPGPSTSISSGTTPSTGTTNDGSGNAGTGSGSPPASGDQSNSTPASATNSGSKSGICRVRKRSAAMKKRHMSEMKRVLLKDKL